MRERPATILSGWASALIGPVPEPGRSASRCAVVFPRICDRNSALDGLPMQVWVHRDSEEDPRRPLVFLLDLSTLPTASPADEPPQGDPRHRPTTGTCTPSGTPGLRRLGCPTTPAHP
jgi:hypothetical protein